MSAVDISIRHAPTVTTEWEDLQDRRVYRCAVVIYPEPQAGGFSAFVKDLPGAVSQGETLGEALANITEAVTGVLRVYLEDASGIPWERAERKLPPASEIRWIEVDV